MRRLLFVTLALVAGSLVLTLASSRGSLISWAAGFLCGASGALIWAYWPWRS